MNTRTKSFEERRQELAGSIDIISASLRELEQTGKTHFLKSVASQLRALVVYEPKSKSLNHPLLFELAKERGFPLTVYTSDPTYLDKIKSMFGDSLVFYSKGDPFSLEKDEMYNTSILLEDAMEGLSVEMLGEQITLKQLLRKVADTEASHYDPEKSTQLDNMALIELGGLPSHYRVLYTLGKVIRDLGLKFLEFTE